MAANNAPKGSIMAGLTQKPASYCIHKTKNRELA